MRSEAVRGRAAVGEDFGRGSQCAPRRQNLAAAGILTDPWPVDLQPLVCLTFVIVAVSFALAIQMGYSVHF